MATRLFRLLLSFICILTLTLLLPAAPAGADIAPPQQPPGSSLAPGQENTRVRMLAERVLIDVQSGAPEDSLGQARVSAVFRMQNLGQDAEAIAVRFPVSVNDGFSHYPEVAELRVEVDSQVVPTRNSAPVDGTDNKISWTEFDVVFPADELVTIEVSYLLEGTGEYPFISFDYLLETGAGWAGAIGEVEIILQLPYEASPQNVIFDEQIGWSQTTPGGELDGSQVRWHYEELEPTRADNLQVSLVMPSAWASVLRERDNVAADPGDGEAWGRLGKVNKEIIYLRRWLRADPVGLELYQLGKDAYQKAVDLLPDDAWWHAGYAELLWRGAVDPFHPRGLDDLLLALRELDRALQLDPDNELALEIIDQLTYEYPEAVTPLDGAFRFNWLTATPEFSPTPTSTIEPSQTPTRTRPVPPTSTPLPPADTPQSNLQEDLASRTPTPESSSVSGTEAPAAADGGESASSLPVCGAALLIPFMPLGVVILRRRR